MAAWVVFGLVMLVILAGLLWTNRATINGWFEGAPPAEGNPLLPASEAEVARAEQLLADLQVVAAHDWASDYRRDAFGPTWADTDANGELTGEEYKVWWSANGGGKADKH